MDENIKILMFETADVVGVTMPHPHGHLGYSFIPKAGG